MDRQERPPPYACPSFESLYEQYYELAFRALRYLGVPPAELEDVAQDLWLVVHRQLPGFEGRSSARTWVFAIARNVALSRRRRARRKPPGVPMPDDLASSGPSPERVQAGRESLALVEGYLATLSEARRVLFVSHLIEDLGVAECADLLGLDVSRVYHRVRDLRRGFQRWLEEHDRA